MDKRPTDLKTIHSSSEQKCDLHFLVESEIFQTKERVEKLENKIDSSYDTLNRNINDLVLQMRTYMAQQEFRDSAQKDVKTMTLNNSGEISELKSSIKSVKDQNKSVVDAIGRMESTISTLSGNIRDMDKTVISKDEITDIVKNAIVADKNVGRDQWFESLPAKVSAGAAVLSFIAFFTIKIVLMLLAV